jgi:hypothetical protein
MGEIHGGPWRGLDPLLNQCIQIFKERSFQSGYGALFARKVHYKAERWLCFFRRISLCAGELLTRGWLIGARNLCLQWVLASWKGRSSFCSLVGFA